MSRRGTVVRAAPATFAGLEKAARRQNAKGVYIERGPHAKAAQIQTWLNPKKYCGSACIVAFARRHAPPTFYLETN